MSSVAVALAAIPRRWIFPLAGLALALGSPAGLLLLRSAVAQRWPTPALVAGELGAEPATYLYLAVSTCTAFILLGWFLGAKEDRLRQSAITDGLTGLHNRRWWHERLGVEISRAVRYGAPLALLLIDVDDLKALNDGGGHGAGDRALRRVAAALRGAARASDLTARHGGDEFAVIAPHTQAREAAELGERIRVELAARGRIPTVSIGVADLACSDEPTVEGLCRAADAALYRAKRAGRDCVLVALEHVSGVRRDVRLRRRGGMG